MAKALITEKKLGDIYSNDRIRRFTKDDKEVYMYLAYCFQQLNKETRTEKKIIHAKHWTAMDGNGDLVHRFKFHIRYDENNEYLYIYEFEKCSFLTQGVIA